MTHTITIDESQRQMIMLALAKLRMERPGWDYALGEIAERFPGGRTMYEQFVTLYSEDGHEPGAGGSARR